MSKIKYISRVAAAAGAGMMMIALGTASASATPGPVVPGYSFDGTAHVIVGGGSDTTWRVMLNLSTDYNIATGCPNTPPSPIPPAAALDTCSSPIPSVDTLGNFDHDTVSQAYPTGSSAGIAALNQDIGGSGGTPAAECYSGGTGDVDGNPIPCGTTGSRFVTDGVTVNNSTTITSATANFTSADIGKPLTGETNIPSGETITAVASSSSATISSPANGNASGVVFQIGAIGPTIDFARSSRAAKTSSGDCIGGNELTCDTFWGFAEDGVELMAFNDSSCLGNMTFSDMNAIWSGTVKTWGALNSLDSGTNALCVAGRASSDPIIPWGMNTASGTEATFASFISATSPVPSKPGTDESLSSGTFPFENDIKPIVNDVVSNGMSAPVSGTTCGAGLSTTLSSPCDPDNWMWWSSFGVLKAFSYLSNFDGVSSFPLEVQGVIPSLSKVGLGTYPMDRTLYHITKNADATCPQTTPGTCAFSGNPGPGIGTGSTTCSNGSTFANCDLNVVGAPGGDGISGAITEFTRWLCRPNANDQAIDPFTGANYDTVITGDLGGSDFTRVPNSLLGSNSTFTRCLVVS